MAQLLLSLLLWTISWKIKQQIGFLRPEALLSIYLMLVFKIRPGFTNKLPKTNHFRKNSWRRITNFPNLPLKKRNLFAFFQSNRFSINKKLAIIKLIWNFKKDRNLQSTRTFFILSSIRTINNFSIFPLFLQKVRLNCYIDPMQMAEHLRKGSP